MENERDIVERALEIADPRERDEFLERECGADPATREKINSLLRLHESSGDFTVDRKSAPGSGFSGAAEAEFEPGTMIGPYRLMEQIGSGGMGVVFIALQTRPVRRQVALKVIKPGMDTREVMHRFEAERQALALMDHPNIARVFDAGTTANGRPFFVMELVRGIPITRFCDNNKLPGRERLALFLDVCQAIQHAHQKGIIHRDIKPGNILITMHDHKAVVKVIDFGVAKAIHQPLTEATVYTRFTQMLGTPLYMSPEQAEMSGLDIDTRSDIYSLGVVLYELLTGETPFDRQRLKQAAFDEMRRIIREEDPPSPSSRISSLGASAVTASQRQGTDSRHLRQSLRGDLDWIVMKSLEKDRNRRYETANALAMDVQRHLRHEPVLAGPPGAVYRMQKFIRRNRAPVMAGCLVVVSLILGVIGTSLGMIWAKQQQHRADQAAAAESLARKDAEQEAQIARSAVQQMLTAVGDERLRNIPLMDSLRTQLLEEALRFNQKFLEQKGSLADQMEAGRSFLRVARIYGMLHRDDDSMNALEKGRGLFQDLVDAGNDNHQAVYWLAETDRRIAIELMKFGQNTGAEQALVRSLAAFDRLVNAPDGESDHNSGAASAHLLLSEIRRRTGNNGEAETELHKSLSIHENIADSATETAEPGLGHAATRLALAKLYIATQRAQPAREQLNAALSIHKALVARFPNERTCREALADNHEQMGSFFLQTGRHAEARRSFQLGLDVLESLVREFPQIPDYRLQMGSGTGGIAIALAVSGELEAAEIQFREASRIVGELHTEFPKVPGFQWEYANSLKRMAVHQINAIRYEEAIQTLHQVFDLWVSLSEKLPENVSYRLDRAETAFLIADLARRIDTADPEAESWIEKAIRISEPLSIELPDETRVRHKLAKYYRLLALIRSGQGDSGQAERLLRQAVSIQRQLLEDVSEIEEYHRHLAITLHELSKLLFNEQRLAEAEVAIRESIDIREKMQLAHPSRLDYPFETAMSRDWLGRLLQESGDDASAEQEYREAFRISTQLIGQAPGHVPYSEVRLTAIANLTSLLKTLDRFDDAIPFYELAYEQLVAESPGNSPRQELYRRSHELFVEWVHWLIEKEDFDSVLGRLNEFSGLHLEDGTGNYVAAELAAECVAKLASQDTGDDAARLKWTADFGSLAVACLRRALENGHDDWDQFESRAEFESIASLAAFQEFVKTVDGRD